MVILPLPPCPQKLLDRVQDRVAVRDTAGADVFALSDHFRDVIEKLAVSVRTFYLPLAEQVDPRQQLLRKDLDALGDVVAPVVAVGEMERVDVPLVRRV